MGWRGRVGTLTRYGGSLGRIRIRDGQGALHRPGDRLADDPVGGGATGRVPCPAQRRLLERGPADSIAPRRPSPNSRNTNFTFTAHSPSTQARPSAGPK